MKYMTVVSEISTFMNFECEKATFSVSCSTTIPYVKLD